MHAKTVVIAITLGLVMATFLPGQVRSAEEKVAGLRDSKRPDWAVANYKLQVRLNNARTIIGVAKDGRLFERIVLQAKAPTEFEKELERKFNIKTTREMSQKFIISKPTREDVGIRLWHHDSTGGYIFLLYQDILNVKRLRIITPAELKELDARAQTKMSADKAKIQEGWLAYRKKQREALEERMAKRQAEGKDGKDAKGGKGDGEDPDASQLQELFDKYHPSKGWTPGRKRVIEWRQWTVGAFPTEEEKAWLANYDPWKKAYDKWVQATGETDKADKTDKSEKSDTKPAPEKEKEKEKAGEAKPGEESPTGQPESGTPGR